MGQSTVESHQVGIALVWIFLNPPDRRTRLLSCGGCGNLVFFVPSSGYLGFTLARFSAQAVPILRV